MADPRTSSVAVTASKDMMEQIASMVEQLDQDSPRVPHVSVVHLENGDPQQVQQVLQDMFQSTRPRGAARIRSVRCKVGFSRTPAARRSGTTMGIMGLGTGRTGLGGTSF